MSFDLAVFAVDGTVEAATVAAMFDRCRQDRHLQGRPDARIIGFYQRLRAAFPDYPPYPENSPWTSMPLSVGTDHVFMHLSWGERGDRALEAVWQLAAEYGLTIWDPQGRAAHRP